ncbi:hypothetical protein [Archangium violaceum]|uniref:hypothetical protein n=1 Tax=Archangium violaceum TaxID=83451 RepID=UPI0036D9F090
METPLDRWMRPALAAGLLALGGCGKDQPARFQPPPGAPTGGETLHQPAKLTSVESDQKDALGRPLRVSCESCHSLRETKPMPSRPEELKEFHQGLQFRHGELACTSCHQANQPRSLHLATGEPLPMTEALTLCAQCHGPQYRDFKAGAHGGMTGYWDLSRGDRTRNHCVSCHDPHSPKYAGGHPVMPPRHPAAQGGTDTKEAQGHE